MAKRKTFEKKTIVKHYCDVPMAEKKHYLPCEHDCMNCHACIAQLSNGEVCHFPFFKGGYTVD